MDVITAGRDHDDAPVRVRRRPPTSRWVPVTAGVALVAAVSGFLVGRADGAGWLPGSAVSDLTGRMVLELQDGSYVQEQSVTDQLQLRAEDWQGTISVESGGIRTGAARLRGSASYVVTDLGPTVAHMWGSADVTLDGQSCTGTYAHSAYRSSDDGGGSMQLRCDGGSVVGATITAQGTEPPTDDGTRNWRITVALTDGYLVE